MNNDNNEERKYYVDKKELNTLRIERRYQEAYDMVKEAFSIDPNSGFLAMQYLISTIDLYPFDSEKIKKAADTALMTSHKSSGYFGYVIYFLSIDDAKQAFEYFKLIKSSDFFFDLTITKMINYKAKEKFKLLIFDLEVYLKKLEREEITNTKYNFYTLEIARHYDRVRDFKNAVIYYNKTIEKRNEKQCQYAYSRLAFCHNQLGNYDEAKTYYKKAVEIAEIYKLTGYLKCVHEYAFSLVLCGDYDEALKQADILEEKGVQRDKNMATSIRGKVYFRQSKYEDAIREFESLLDKEILDRKNALIDLIKAYRALVDYDNAKYYLDILYDEYPTMDPIIKASFYYDFKKNEECINYCKGFISTKYEEEAYYFMGKAYTRMGMYNEARICLESVKDTSSKIATYFELGFIYEKLGYYEKSLCSYKNLISLAVKRRDKTLLSKGIAYIISLLSNHYEFTLAEEYLEKYKEYFPHDTDSINKLYGIYYYRKQDFENAKICFKNLYGTRYEKEAKNYLIVCYRYNGDKEESEALLSELASTNSSSHVVLNRAKLLTDYHTKDSLIEAYMSLYNIKDSEAKHMVIAQMLQILIRLGKYKRAEEMLEEAYNCYSITEDEYEKYGAYILLKSGKTEQIEEDLKTPFINSCINYDPVKAINNIVYLNNYNKGIRSLDLNDDELTEFFYEMLNNLDNYDYYMSDLHDIYVIDMGDTAGYYYGLDTNYISIKCEQGTHNIHLIEPTLKKINATKYQGKVRIRTDIVED